METPQKKEDLNLPELPVIELPTRKEKEAIFAALCDKGSYDHKALEEGKCTTHRSLLQLTMAAKGIAILSRDSVEINRIALSFWHLQKLTRRHSLFDFVDELASCDFTPEYYQYFLKKNNLSENECNNGVVATWLKETGRSIDELLKQYVSAFSMQRESFYVAIYNAKIVLDAIEKVRAQKTQGGTVHWSEWQ